MPVDTINSECLGFALNTSQKLAIRNSLAKLRINEGNNDIRFWGKISGSVRDYFIAIGQTVGESIKKTFYFSADEGLTFSKLPEVDDFVVAKSKIVSGLFTGNPANTYKDPNAPKEEEEEEPEEEEEEGAAKVPDPSKRKLNELERLSYVVEGIEADCCVAPRGAYFLTPTGSIKKNSAFEGLSSADIADVSNFLLFRDPESAKTLARIRKLGVSNNFDFLDVVGEGAPAGVWVSQLDASGAQIKLRSLVWPGYEYKIEAGSINYGGAYFGTGLKNDDVLFML